MHLKSLELQGFKSFPDKTVLAFDDGATVIVGPNGSGKSNITDAMRWVLGEISSKNIRGSKLEDVIFIGTEVRKPMGFAEVSVTFDNSSEEGRLDSPYNEVTVTRKYNRSGKSEYFINRNPCRLSDIYQLLMNTGVGREGYSIIGQGRIAEIISKKSEDRRNIFEEAAGISKTRHSKNESEKKLKSTQENIDKVIGVYRELQRRIGPLEEEAQKAKEYLQLYERRKRADVSLWIYDSQKSKEEIEALSKEIKMLSHELDMAQDSLQQIEKQENALSERFRQTKLDEERVYSEIKACNTTISDLDKDLAIMETNFKHAESISGEEIKEIERLDAKKILAESDISQKEKNRAELENNLKKLKDEFNSIHDEQARIRLKRDEIVKEIDDLFIKQKELNSEKDKIAVRIAFLESISTNDKQKANDNDDSIQQHKNELESLTDEAESKAKDLAIHEGNLSRLENELAQYEADISEKTQRFDELKEQCNSLESKSLALKERINALNSMEELFEGYAKSVTYIMNAYNNGELKNVGEIYGPISKLISVEKDYVLAIETALGIGLQHIVVDNERTAKGCISALKESKSGRATFYPVSSVTAQSSTVEMQNAKKFNGYIGVANELLKFDSKFENIFSSLLGRTLIFDNIDNATEMAKAQKYRVKVVTLDGQQINVGGSFTGGSSKHESNILSRGADIKRMQDESEHISEEIKIIKSEGKALGETLRNLTQNFTASKQQYNIIDTVYRSEKTEYEKLAAQIKVKRELLEGLELDKKRLIEDEKRSVLELAELSKKTIDIEAEIEEINTKRLDLDDKKYGYEFEIDDFSSKLNKNELDTVKIQKDIEVYDASIRDDNAKLDEIIEEINARKAKMQRLSDDVGSFSERNAANRQAYGEAQNRLAEFEAKRQSLFLLEQQIEQKRNELSLKSKEISSRKENTARNHGTNEQKYKQLVENHERMKERLKSEYELEPTEAMNMNFPVVTEKNRKEFIAEANECRQKMKDLGQINTSAIETFEEEKKRYDFMDAQMTDLEKAKEFILNQIATLEEEMKTKFIAAFNAVNENFNEVFKELFGGGHAELLLDNPEDILNCGIEIKAAPPGKVIKSLMLLSGGEQAFVAIALLFAILKVNPTPFCIFDEIEAALDEVNVTRFGQYIKRYSNQTQFIVITHRRGTMEIADKLYGVTMPQKGISKVLTMDINDIGNDKILNTNTSK